MANIVRGFRRVGWVLIVPVAALIFLVVFERTKEFSATGYEFKTEANRFPDLPAGFVSDIPGLPNVVEIPGLGHAHFSQDVPADVTATIVSDFAKSHPLFSYDEAVKHGGKRAEDWFAVNAPPDTLPADFFDSLAELINLSGSTKATIAPGKEAVVRELYGRRKTLDPQRRSLVEGLASRLGIADPPVKVYLDENGRIQEAGTTDWQFTVHEKVNKLKLTGLVAASLALPALIIQGLISIFAWVIRGFQA